MANRAGASPQSYTPDSSPAAPAKSGAGLQNFNDDLVACIEVGCRARASPPRHESHAVRPALSARRPLPPPS
jgi:hypothetical protein